MAISLTCDGVTRRDFLKVGAAGAGLSLSGFLGSASAGEVQGAKATSAILINLDGGPSHLDTFDLKPDAPAEFRGAFHPIKKNVAGIEICEHLPKLARCADKFTLLRGVTHTLGTHELAAEYVNSGNRPVPSQENPGYAQVFATENQATAQADLPPFVAIPSSSQRFGQPFSVREAFDISQENPSFAEPFGSDGFGQSCLLATRLVEWGVRFCSISLGGWDTHGGNFTRLKTRLCPSLDTGLSALLSGLSQKGLLESTVVFVTGEFGRTPKINQRSAEGGRDHYPRCMFMILAGGGIQGGQVLGESDDKGARPKHEGFSPADVAASFYRALGIDDAKIVCDGNVIPALFV